MERFDRPNSKGRVLWAVVLVVVPDADSQDLLQVSASDDQQPVQALQDDAHCKGLIEQIPWPKPPHREASSLVLRSNLTPPATSPLAVGSPHTARDGRTTLPWQSPQQRCGHAHYPKRWGYMQGYRNGYLTAQEVAGIFHVGPKRASCRSCAPLVAIGATQLTGLRR